MPKKLGNHGLGVIEILAIILIVAAIVFSGWAVWRHNHNTKNPSSTTSSLSTKTTDSQKSTDPYAGWKTYCDNVNDYCLRYPVNWKSMGSNTPAKVGYPGGISLISPKQTVQVVYSNAYTADTHLANFLPTKIEQINSAHQNLTLLGGYMPSSDNNGVAGNNIPYFRIIDSSLLNTYKLQIGQTGLFPGNPRFTDVNSHYSGAFFAQPAITIETVDQSKAWLNSSETLTAVKILESLYYKG